MNFNSYFPAQAHMPHTNPQMMTSSPLSTLGEINFINPQEYDIIYDDSGYGQNRMGKGYLSSSTNLISNGICDDGMLNTGIVNGDGVSKLLPNHNSMHTIITNGNKDEVNYHSRGFPQSSLPLYPHYHYHIDSNISNGAMPSLENVKITDQENKSIPVNSLSNIHTTMQPDSMCQTTIRHDTLNIQKMSENSFSYNSTINLQKNIW